VKKGVIKAKKDARDYRRNKENAEYKAKMDEFKNNSNKDDLDFSDPELQESCGRRRLIGKRLRG
jgi:hypothetical protein